LSSGEYVFDKKIKGLKRGENYRLLIRMPTINKEAYEWVKDHVKKAILFLFKLVEEF